MNARSKDNATLKTVGASGQVSLGKKLAGRHYEMVQHPDGSILLAPVTVSRPAQARVRRGKTMKRGRPQFHVFKVRQFEIPGRDEIHRRGPVR